MAVVWGADIDDVDIGIPDQVILPDGCNRDAEFRGDPVGFFLRGRADPGCHRGEGERAVKEREIPNRPGMGSAHGAEADQPDAQGFSFSHRNRLSAKKMIPFYIIPHFFFFFKGEAVFFRKNRPKRYCNLMQNRV